MNFNLDEYLAGLQKSEDEINQQIPYAPGMAPQAMNPVVKDYLMKKAGPKPASAADPMAEMPQPMPPPIAQEKPNDVSDFMKNYSADKLKAAQDAASEQKSGLGWAQFAAGFGDALAGRSPHESAKTFDSIRKNIDDQNVGAFERQKASAVQDIGTKKNLTEISRENEKTKREDDPNSDETKMSQALASQMGMDPSFVKKLTATKFKELSPVTLKLYELREKSLDRREQRDERRFLSGEKRNEKIERNTEQDMQKLSKDLSGTQEMVGAVDEVEKILGGKLEDFDTKNGLKKNGKNIDLPGVSIPLVGRTSFYDGDARDLNAAASRVFNATLKDRSGGAVTDNEMERLKREFNEGKYNTEAEMIGAMQRYKRQLDVVMKNREAGYKPDVVKKYQDQGGRTSRGGASASVSNKPQRINQNGHEYILNPSTGKYE
jgi:hypothetical protein